MNGDRVVAWRWAAGTGLERCELARGGDGWTLRGTILATPPGGRPAEVRYVVECDAAWRTTSALVTLRDAAVERSVRLAGSKGRWTVDGRPEPSVDGAVDVDLQWTPSTNTLPIRRLGLPAGASSGPVVAAWVRFPELAVEPLPQQYARLDARRYRYESRGGAFVAELTVDEDGLVEDYGDVWQRVR